MKPLSLLGPIAAALLLAACAPSSSTICRDRGLETGTPEYRQCLEKEQAEIRKRSGFGRGGPPGGGR